MIKVSPSILASDFANLEREIGKICDAGADYVHVDVMDGHFVPNLSLGLPEVAAIRRICPLPLDVHLMIDRPLRYVPRFLDAGADILTLHVEADTAENTLHALELIRDAGRRPAVSIKPATPAEAVAPFLHLCGLVLVMTVEPGFGGQKLIPDTLEKVRRLRARIDRETPGCELEVDGGVTEQTAPLCINAGANVIVTGSGFFKAPDPRAYTQALHAM